MVYVPLKKLKMIIKISEFLFKNKIAGAIETELWVFIPCDVWETLPDFISTEQISCAKQ